MNNLIDIGLYVAYLLLFVTLLGVIIFPLIQTFSDFKKAKSGLIGLAGLVLLFFLAYTISPADQGLFYTNFNIGPKMSKFLGGGLFATYFIFLGVIISILYAEVSKFIK
jgi:hypothetical protein